VRIGHDLVAPAQPVAHVEDLVVGREAGILATGLLEDLEPRGPPHGPREARGGWDAQSTSARGLAGRGRRVDPEPTREITDVPTRATRPADPQPALRLVISRWTAIRMDDAAKAEITPMADGPSADEELGHGLGEVVGHRPVGGRREKARSGADRQAGPGRTRG
jgi:hypothetical protein